MIKERNQAIASNRSLKSIVAFAVPALLGVAAVAAAISWKQELFVSRTPIFMFTDSALGVTKGMPVKVFGLNVGTVNDITIVPGSTGTKSQVRIELAIGSEYLQYIPKDAKARLAREAVVGQSIIEIAARDSQARPVAKNEVIAYERGKSLSELSEELNKSLAPVLTQVKDAINDLKNPEGTVQKTVHQVTTLLQELPESNRKLQSLITTAEGAVVNVDKSVGSAAAKLDDALGHFGKASASIESAAPGILQKVDAAAEGIARTAEAVRRISEDAARRVPALLDGGEQVIRDTSSMVAGAKTSWPISNWVEAPRVTTLYISSEEAGPSRRAVPASAGSR